MRPALALLAAGFLLDPERAGRAPPAPGAGALENGVNEAARSREDPVLLELPLSRGAVTVPVPAPERRTPRLKRASKVEDARMPRKRVLTKAKHHADRSTSAHLSTEEEIVTLGRAHYKNFVIVTAANYAYRGILVNWMEGVHKLRIDNYVVLCLDDELVRFMEQIGRPCIHRPAQGPGHVWFTRFQTASILLNGGMNVLMSDTDAIWLKDPTDLLQGDIAASRGNMPEDVTSKFGAAACMGFIYFRSVAPVRMLVDDVLSKGVSAEGKNFDDQIEFNKALVEHGLKFPKKLDFKRSEEIDYGSASIGENMTIRIAMLDSRRFRRFTRPNDDVYIAHLGTAHIAATKEAQLKASGLWYLRKSWESQTGADISPSASHGDFGAWIEGVRTLSP